MPKRHVKRHAVTQPTDTSYRLIALTQGQNAIVDSSDYEQLNQFNWCAMWVPKAHGFYVVRSKNIGGGRFRLIQMARDILDCNPKEEADHRDRNTLNNRRENIRKATRLQNGSNRGLQSNNTSGFIGVHWIKKSKNWVARIKHKQKLIHIGCFDSPEEAARAHDKYAKQLHGEFAVLNF